MSRLFRRFSLRKRSRPSMPSGDPASPRSWPNLHDQCKISEATTSSSIQALPDFLLLKCLDLLDDPFMLIRLRAVNRTFRCHIDARLATVTHMDVRRVDFDNLCHVFIPNSMPCISMTSNNNHEKTLYMDEKTWFMHPVGHKLLMRFDAKNVDIIVDEHWTSKEVIVLCGAMCVFRPHLRHISLDAPIIELIIASLSLIDLDRWYAFQCFMQAINDHQVHLNFGQMPAYTEKTAHELYWPQAETLLIRTNERDSFHLARLLDYGVRSQLVMDRRRLNELKILLTDVDKMNRCLNRNLYHFRCWAGSAGFDDRFSQQYGVDVA